MANTSERKAKKNRDREKKKTKDRLFAANKKSQGASDGELKDGKLSLYIFLTVAIVGSGFILYLLTK